MFGVMLLLFAMLFHYTATVMEPSLSLAQWHRHRGRGGPAGMCHCRYIPSEKIGQNIDPLRNSFFVANYQHWTSTRALEPFLGPLDPWGALGGPWVVWGGLTTQKLPFSFRDQSKPWNGLFWLTITSYTMFLRFWVKMGPSGPKKGCFWPK